MTGTAVKACVELLMDRTVDYKLTRWRWSAAYSTNSLLVSNAGSQQTWDVDPALVYCWASVVNGGPTVNQRWANASIGQFVLIK